MVRFVYDWLYLKIYKRDTTVSRQATQTSDERRASMESSNGAQIWLSNVKTHELRTRFMRPIRSSMYPIQRMSIDEDGL